MWVLERETETERAWVLDRETETERVISIRFIGAANRRRNKTLK